MYGWAAKPMCREQQYLGYKLSSGPVEAAERKQRGQEGRKSLAWKNRQTGASKFSNSFQKDLSFPTPRTPRGLFFAKHFHVY